MPRVTVDHSGFRRTKLDVVDTGGPGRPVVLIHDWPFAGASWSEQVPALKMAGYRVITYDRRGFGLSDKPKRGYDYEVLAEDLRTLIHELAVQDATLVGLGMGGGEVARYLARYGPARVRSVVFAASTAPDVLRTPDNPHGPMTEKAARLLVDEFLSYPDEFYIQFVKECFAASEEPQVADLHRAAALAMARQAGLEAAFGCLRAWVTTDLRPDLSHVSVPALVIHGDHDVVVPYEGSGERTHRALADSEVHLIRGGPHSCHIANASEFNEVLVGFLSRGAARGSADASLDSAGP